MPDHLPHLEDLLFDGEEGFRRIQRVFDAFRRDDFTNFSLKFDGSPAVYWGTDPADGKKFVAKKSILNKTPVVYKTDADVDAHINSSPALNAKMKACLRLLPKVDGVVQGDLLWSSPDEVTRVELDDGTYTTFHPNTIRYHISDRTHTAEEVRASQLGIVPHSHYSFDSSGVGGEKRPVPRITFPDSVVVFYPSSPLLVESVSEQFHEGTWLLPHPMDFETSETKQSMNAFVREGRPFENTYGSPFFSTYVEVFASKGFLLEAFFRSMASHSMFRQTLLRTDGSWMPTFHEGLVYDDGEFHCKLVDRRLFSYANFSEKFHKGWGKNK